jgi:glyoxylase-like metal-dependent hydrolase (beta-lactamase superfamily II)
MIRLTSPPDVEIWCHEAEFKNAFWACATGVDKAMYMPQYLDVGKLNWKTFSQKTLTLWPGITLHRCPGHTDGSIVVQLELENEGTIVMTGDMFHVKENYEDGRPQGPLMRDFNEWHRSRQYIRNLVQQTTAKVLLGHDVSYFNTFKRSPDFMD